MINLYYAVEEVHADGLRSQSNLECAVGWPQSLKIIIGKYSNTISNKTASWNQQTHQNVRISNPTTCAFDLLLPG
jgi:hypothetical protein